MSISASDGLPLAATLYVAPAGVRVTLSPMALSIPVLTKAISG